jgi:hypothetical protein
VFADNATGYLDQVFAPTVQRGIHFSSTHGNHDNAVRAPANPHTRNAMYLTCVQNNINHLEEIEYEQKHYSNLSYTRSDVGPKPYGPGNYCMHLPRLVKDATLIP